MKLGLIFNLDNPYEPEPKIPVTNPPISTAHVYLCYDSLEEPMTEWATISRAFYNSAGEDAVYSWWTVVAIGRLRRAF